MSAGRLPLALALLSASWAASAEFRPGEVWPDTDGQAINAHGGGVLHHQGVYYWYGELKRGRTWTPDCNRSWGAGRAGRRLLLLLARPAELEERGQRAARGGR